ncbi:DUF1232 domain-containing protein [bacterium]|nr:DUF1232 domain-containing protein [bacterium]
MEGEIVNKEEENKKEDKELEKREDEMVKDIVLGVIAILYVFSPIDIIPDALIGVGQIDDAAVLVFGIQRLYRAYKIHKEIKNKD